jgi:hypothetical protein
MKFLFSKKWDDNIKMELRELGSGDMGSISSGSGQGAMEGSC